MKKVARAQAYLCIQFSDDLKECRWKLQGTSLTPPSRQTYYQRSDWPLTNGKVTAPVRITSNAPCHKPNSRRPKAQLRVVILRARGNFLLIDNWQTSEGIFRNTLSVYLQIWKRSCEPIPEATELTFGQLFTSYWAYPKEKQWVFLLMLQNLFVANSKGAFFYLNFCWLKFDIQTYF